jgi:hypothetical protein
LSSPRPAASTSVVSARYGPPQRFPKSARRLSRPRLTAPKLAGDFIRGRNGTWRRQRRDFPLRPGINRTGRLCRPGGFPNSVDAGVSTLATARRRSRVTRDDSGSVPARQPRAEVFKIQRWRTAATAGRFRLCRRLGNQSSSPVVKKSDTAFLELLTFVVRRSQLSAITAWNMTTTLYRLLISVSKKQAKSTSHNPL